MDEHSLIGVVTVTFNSGTVLRAFMDSMLKQTHAEFRLYVVDNASSDNTLELIFEHQDARIVVIPSQANVGVAEGNNIGIRAALKDGCASVLLINNDTEFGSSLLSELVAGLAGHECDMIVPKILYFDQPDRIWCAGGTLSHIRGSARHFGSNQKDDGNFDLPRAVSYSPTCCMLIKREVFMRIGLMDSNYFVYFDDTDFCQRAFQAGIKLFYLPSARLSHKVASLTGGVESDFSTRYGVRNRVYYLAKNFPHWQVFFRVPAYHVYVFVKYFFVVRRPRSFWVAQKAFWEGVSLSFGRAKRTDQGPCLEDGSLRPR